MTNTYQANEKTRIPYVMLCLILLLSNLCLAYLVVVNNSGESTTYVVSSGQLEAVRLPFRFWTPVIPETSENSTAEENRLKDQYILARDDIEEIILENVGGWSKWLVHGNWRDPETGIDYPEDGIFYEVYFMDPIEPEIITSTIRKIEEILLRKDRFNQQSVFFTGDNQLSRYWKK